MNPSSNSAVMLAGSLMSFFMTMAVFPRGVMGVKTSDYRGKPHWEASAAAGLSVAILPALC